MSVERIILKGNDLDVVNAARVSFNNETDEMRPQDERLIKYLADHGHWSPFAHAHLTLMFSYFAFKLESEFLSESRPGFEITKEMQYYRVCGSLYAWINNISYFTEVVRNAVLCELNRHYPSSLKAFDLYIGEHTPFPVDVKVIPNLTATFRITTSIFVARQLVKHQIGLAWNEVSRRYVDEPPEYHEVDIWRSRPDGSIKQGSGGTPVANQGRLNLLYKGLIDHADRVYSEILKEGVAPEQARMVLPLATKTSWWWTGTMRAWDRVLHQRLDPHAQKETQDEAILLKRILYK